MRLFDIVGDIHGHACALERLLGNMGYEPKGKGYVHPERTLLFLGDLIDRGTQEYRVVEIAKAMVEAGDGICLMGNHEFNAICYATALTSGGYVRPHSEKNTRHHQAFLNEFPLDSTRHTEAINFFRTLPLWFETDQFRAIHACWHPPSMQSLLPYLNAANVISDSSLYQLYGNATSPVFEDIEVLVKGVEFKLPESARYEDADGHFRRTARVRWWDMDSGVRNGFTIPPEVHDRHDLTEVYNDAKVYAYNDDKLVFFGHYWMKGFEASAYIGAKACCLDFSAIKSHGELVGCRLSSDMLMDAEWFSVGHAP